jgi:hypothetical protein
MMKKSIYIKVLFTLFFIFAPFYAANAAASDNVSGYAWTDTIGWISFNCTNDSTCGASSYGVKEDASGLLTGYAWSDNIGWIKFGGLSSFPSGSGTLAKDAQLSGSNLIGWARACAGTASGDCSDMTSRTDGWDGWISLSGTNYGITKVGNNYVGYAWGGEVVGWVLFDIQGQVPGGCTGTCGVTVGGGTATFDVKSGGTSGPSIANNPSVPWGTIPTFVWTISQPSMTCDLTKTAGGTPFTNQNGLTSDGSINGSALTVSGVHTYAFDCTNPTFNKTVTFTVAPQPSTFSLGGTETIRIQFAGPGAANSEIKYLYVTPSGPFTEPVTISVTNSPTPPVGVTYTYSLGGSAFSANPPAVVINSPYGSGQAFQVRVSQKITTPFTVTLTGTTPSGITVTKDFFVNPTGANPIFEER